MLPRMPGVKKCIFTKHLVAIHLTFAPFGRGHAGKPIGIIWNESISGRCDEDVTSTYIKYIKEYMRNTALVQLVNDEVHFEPGHTADSFHRSIEQEMKR